jgi:trk system potassium uptake protein TrkH
MELSSLSKEGYRYKSSKTIVVITKVYVLLTLVFFFSLWAAGMSSFDALNHAFSLAATGGFSSRNLSIGYFQSDLINILVIFFMAISALHFGLIYAVFITRSMKPLNNTVVKYYFGSIAVMSLAIMFALMSEGGYESWGRAAMDSTFTVVSYMTTTGFAICDNSVWPWIAGMVLIFASFQCGCSGSTTGGLKVDRVIISFKAMANEVQRRLHPTAISQVRLGGHILPDSTVHSVMLYIVVYFIVIFLSIIGVLLCGSEIPEAVSGVIASVGSVGPGLAEVGAMDSYAFQPAMAKFIYSIDMFLGRVEIFPVLVVLSLLFKRNR